MNIKNILLAMLVVLFAVSCTNDDNYNDKNGDKAVIPPTGTTVKMMTYNIYGARATNPSNAADLDALAAVIRAQDPDFVALQEVDVFTNRTGKTVHQARDLAEKLGMEWHFSKAIDKDGGEYGDAVLSKHPISEKLSYMLPVSAELPGENRSVSVIKVNIEGQDLYVGSTHFDHLSQETNRKLQAEELRKVVNGIEGDLILGGDFNAFPSSETMSIVGAYMSFGCRSGCGYTFPATKPDRLIDYILYKPIENFAVRNYDVVDERLASDHRPVVSTLRLRIEDNAQ